MSDPNPYADDSYKWGPPQQPAGPPVHGYPQPFQEAPPQPGYGYPAGQPGVPGYGYPAGQPGVPGYGYPGQQGMLPMGVGAPMLSIGDITIMGDSIVTPSGTMPLKGATWTATDMSRTEEKIPTVGIVLAILFALLCLVGLLFLLMKEKKTTGYVQVSVTSAGRHHWTMIPAVHQGTFAMVMAQINTARSLSF
ncbi:hypothetical protein OG693_24625 [Streptomyces sp. NBC_01259]|uniref:hypothetical protein n=1 Tax=Streptomyces sp. NBC_01259 TaxID=2903800 RepID=UPI00324F8D12